MQQSKQRSLIPNRAAGLTRMPLAVAICLAFSPVSFAQQVEDPATTDEDKSQTDTPTLDTVVVTAQKRTENLQEVPISIQVIGTQQLEQHKVAASRIMPS